MTGTIQLTGIPARQGAAAKVRAGQSIRIVNTHGGQVVDMWAFRADDPAEHMSMPHSMVYIDRIKPTVGSVLVSNLRRPILCLSEDTSPGTHCMLSAACDRARYELLGCKTHHDNCADNLRKVAAEFGVPLAYVPTPLNLFMNTRFDANSVMTIEPPQAKAGDAVAFRAEHDCIVAFSACPQDMVPVNGSNCTPKAAAYVILD